MDAQSDQDKHSSLPESLDTIKCINREYLLGLDFLHAQYVVNPHILYYVHARKHFLFDSAKRTYCPDPDPGSYKLSTSIQQPP